MVFNPQNNRKVEAMQSKHNKDMYPCTLQLKGSLWYHNTTLSIYVHFNSKVGESYRLFNMASNAMLNGNRLTTFAGPERSGEEEVTT